MRRPAEGRKHRPTDQRAERHSSRRSAPVLVRVLSFCVLLFLSSVRLRPPSSPLGRGQACEQERSLMSHVDQQIRPAHARAHWTTPSTADPTRRGRVDSRPGDGCDEPRASRFLRTQLVSPPRTRFSLASIIWIYRCASLHMPLSFVSFATRAVMLEPQSNSAIVDRPEGEPPSCPRSRRSRRSHQKPLVDICRPPCDKRGEISTPHVAASRRRQEQETCGRALPSPFLRVKERDIAGQGSFAIRHFGLAETPVGRRRRSESSHSNAAPSNND